MFSNSLTYKYIDHIFCRSKKLTKTLIYVSNIPCPTHSNLDFLFFYIYSLPECMTSPYDNNFLIGSLYNKTHVFFNTFINRMVYNTHIYSWRYFKLPSHKIYWLEYTVTSFYIKKKKTISQQ
jgi:hypothetical protein